MKLGVATVGVQRVAALAAVARPEAATTPTRPFSTLAAAASAPETGPPAAPAPVAPAPEPICVDQLRLLNVELGIHPHATPDDTIARANDIMGFEPIGTPCEQLRKLVAAINVKLAAGLRYAWPLAHHTPLEAKGNRTVVNNSASFQRGRLP